MLSCKYWPWYYKDLITCCTLTHKYSQRLLWNWGRQLESLFGTALLSPCSWITWCWVLCWADIQSFQVCKMCFETGVGHFWFVENPEAGIWGLWPLALGGAAVSAARLVLSHHPPFLLAWRVCSSCRCGCLWQCQPPKINWYASSNNICLTNWCSLVLGFSALSEMKCVKRTENYY